MNPEETMVDSTVQEPADDTQTETLAEESDASESIDSLLTEDSGSTEESNDQPVDESKQSESSSANEPGWIRKRVDKAVAKAVAETEARMQAMFDQQMAPIREKMIEDEARELVRRGEIKNLETAKELIRLRNGQSAAMQEQPKETGSETPRNDKGQFKAKEDPAVKARIQMLVHQADTIRDKRKLDVIAEYQNNKEAHDKIVSGEWDFYDVAEHMSAKGKKAPAPMRSPNGASSDQKSTIANMTSEQFRKLNEKLEAGGTRYRV